MVCMGMFRINVGVSYEKLVLSYLIYRYKVKVLKLVDYTIIWILNSQSWTRTQNILRGIRDSELAVGQVFSDYFILFWMYGAFFIFIVFIRSSLTPINLKLTPQRGRAFAICRTKWMTLQIFRWLRGRLFERGNVREGTCGGRNRQLVPSGIQASYTYDELTEIILLNVETTFNKHCTTSKLLPPGFLSPYMQ